MTDRPDTQKLWRAFEVVTTIAMLGFAAIALWSRWPGRDVSGGPVGARFVVPSEPISISGRPQLGLPSAKVAMIEYLDYECSFCAAVHRETIPTLITDYVDTGRVLFVIKHLPLDRHSVAFDAAVATTCASEQGHFWQMHDEVFGRPSPPTLDALAGAAVAIRLDLRLYETCLAAGSARAIVAEDKAEADRLGIRGTPSFLIGRLGNGGDVRVVEAISGAKPLGTFRAALDNALRLE